MQTNVKVRQTQRTLSFFSITDGVFLYLKWLDKKNDVSYA